MLLVGLTGAHGAAVLRLDTAIVTSTAEGVVSRETVRLPYNWDKSHPGQQGSATFEFEFARDALGELDQIGLYIPKIGNRYRIYLNGELLASEGDIAAFNRSDHALLPRWHLIPGVLLRPHNRLRIDIQADRGRKGGLAVPSLGSIDEIEPAYQSRLRGYVFGSLFVALFSLFVGGVAIAMWLTQTEEPGRGRTRRDPLYGYAALAELTWAAGVIYVLIEDPVVPWPWWGMFTIMALGVWSGSMVLLCIEAAGRSAFPGQRWFRRIVPLLMLACPLAAYAAIGLGMPIVLTLWYACMGVAGVLLLGVFFAHAWRSPKLSSLMLAVAIAINLSVGLFDLYTVRIQQAYEQFTLIRFSSVLFGLALLQVIIVRFNGLRLQARDLHKTLEQRVEEREHQLQQSFRREEQLLRESERTAERRRILQDMHDSVGSNLSLAIRQLESARVPPDQLMDTLRESLDQLKLTIDAVNLAPGDVGGLLANLRYRMADRITQSGIQVDWRIGELPDVPRLDSHDLKQLQFIIYEAISNVLQHARASRLLFSAIATDAVLEIRISDDGCGFDVGKPWRNGLLNMRRRADAIAVGVAVVSEPGWTDVTISVARDATAAPSGGQHAG